VSALRYGQQLGGPIHTAHIFVQCGCDIARYFCFQFIIQVHYAGPIPW
jgi:hypothetical protein